MAGIDGGGMSVRESTLLMQGVPMSAIHISDIENYKLLSGVYEGNWAWPVHRHRDAETPTYLLHVDHLWAPSDQPDKYSKVFGEDFVLRMGRTLGIQYPLVSSDGRQQSLSTFEHDILAAEFRHVHGNQFQLVVRLQDKSLDEHHAGSSVTRLDDSVIRAYEGMNRRGPSFGQKFREYVASL